jgi:hypothetical protein
MGKKSIRMLKTQLTISLKGINLETIWKDDPNPKNLRMKVKNLEIILNI